jgi:methionine synthase II (cobalamin-independent)
MENRLFPVQEIGSLPKAPWLLAYLRGKKVEERDLEHLRKWSKAIDFEAEADVRSTLAQPKTAEAEERLRNLGSLFGIRYLESAGLDYVYDGEANRVEMY